MNYREDVLNEVKNLDSLVRKNEKKMQFQCYKDFTVQGYATEKLFNVMFECYVDAKAQINRINGAYNRLREFVIEETNYSEEDIFDLLRLQDSLKDLSDKTEKGYIELFMKTFGKKEDDTDGI